jgi:hypothetical protein
MMGRKHRKRREARRMWAKPAGWGLAQPNIWPNRYFIYRNKKIIIKRKKKQPKIGLS